MKLVIFIGLAGLLVSCSGYSQKQKLTVANSVGWLHGNCLAIENSALKLPKALTVYQFESDKSFITATITEKATGGDECYALLDDRKDVNLASGYSFYKVNSESPVNIGIGYLKLGAPEKLRFDYCTTTEGMKFSASESNSLIWVGYYYLGYESEATCE